jgi:Domain of unknown function (DUF4384)
MTGCYKAAGSEGPMKVEWIVALGIAAVTLQPGSAQTLTARQLFYQADNEAKPAATPPAAAPAPKKAVPRQKPAPRKKAAPKEAKAETPPPIPEAPAGEAPIPASSGDVPHAANASYVAPRPLGLRYSLVQVNGDSETEVNPKSVFHSGDMVRVKVEGNRDGYLYVISRGSSGNWKPLFPSPEINGGDNRIVARRGYSLPSGTQVFTFAGSPGEERLFVIYSTEPVKDVEALIPGLPQGEKPQGLGAEVVAMNTPPQNMGPITDGFVSEQERIYARDLIVQTVNPKDAGAAADGAKPEDAVYVVNSSGGRLVADIRLEHR